MTEYSQREYTECSQGQYTVTEYSQREYTECSQGQYVVTEYSQRLVHRM